MDVWVLRFQDTGAGERRGLAFGGEVQRFPGVKNFAQAVNGCGGAGVARTGFALTGLAQILYAWESTGSGRDGPNAVEGCCYVWIVEWCIARRERCRLRVEMRDREPKEHSEECGAMERWGRLQGAILEALSRFPEARKAVAEALATHEIYGESLPRGKAEESDNGRRY